MRQIIPEFLFTNTMLPISYIAKHYFLISWENKVPTHHLSNNLKAVNKIDMSGQFWLKTKIILAAKLTWRKLNNMDARIYLERRFDLIFILTFMKLSVSSSWFCIFISVYLRLLMPLIHSFIILEDRTCEVYFLISYSFLIPIRIWK